MNPVAIVIPWFGRGLKGGAEQLAWQIATRLAAQGHSIEVLTTCCQAFTEDWATNHLKPGLSHEQGVIIRRLPVDSRDSKAFDEVNARMLDLLPSELKPGINPITQDDSATFARENITSTEMLRYLEAHKEDYCVFIFLPYLYGPTLYGLPLVSDKAFLQPCLHNEVYAYLPEIEYVFRKAKGLLFNSEGEAVLAAKLYGPGIMRKSVLVGAGVEVDFYTKNRVQKTIFSQISNNRFILYLGRRDPTKNTDLLIRAYGRFKNRDRDSNLQLVLAGPGNKSYHGSIDGVVDLGLVPEEQKNALLSNCLALFQPSRNESYSRVVMEAWLYGRPVVTHKECIATATAVEQAQGGWLAEAEDEWADAFSAIERMSEEILSEYGEKGRAYAEEHAVWDRVIDRYEEVLGLKQVVSPSKPKRGRKIDEIHQLLPDLSYGDAISAYAIDIKGHLQELGYKSEIFIIRCADEQVASQACFFDQAIIDNNAAILYHHSIGSELTPYAIKHPGPKCLMYHSVTPARFFRAYRPDFAKLLEQGQSDLKELARHFSLSVGDSAYNASELTDYGFVTPDIIPIAVNPDKWNSVQDPGLMANLQDGMTNILFVGRIAPNKCQDHLIEAFFHYLQMDSKARLIIVGGGARGDPYYAYLVNTIEKYALTDYIILTGQVSDSELQAYYRTAHLFWSMSEHEGFCVPLIEAMWFDLPVLAYKSSAVPETLGEAGIMFTSKEDFISVAALAKLLTRNEELRMKVLQAQRRRRLDFLPEVIWPKLDNLIAKMEERFS